MVDAELCLQAYADYHDMMDLTEDLIRASALEVTGSHAVEYQGQKLDFGPPFRRASMHDLVKEVTGAQTIVDAEPLTNGMNVGRM